MLPPLPQAELVLDAVLVSGLEQMPAPGNETDRERLDVNSPDNRRALFDALASLFSIKPSAGWAGAATRQDTRILKFLTPSYRTGVRLRRAPHAVRSS